MSFGERRRPGGKALVVIGFVSTLVIHGGIVALVIVGRAQAARQVTEEFVGQFVDVQAVKFGKPRDLSFLPHKEAPQVARGPKPELQLSYQDQAPPRQDMPRKVSIEDPLKRTHGALFKALDTPGRTVEEEGDPNGIRGGNANVGRGPVYYQHLQAAVQNAWVVPTTIADDQLSLLKAQACIKIDESGKITDFRIVKSSTDERFDATLLEALRSIQQFEPPTPDVRDTVSNDGVCMNFAKTR
jgi:hypothetical protein